MYGSIQTLIHFWLDTIRNTCNLLNSSPSKNFSMCLGERFIETLAREINYFDCCILSRRHTHTSIYSFQYCSFAVVQFSDNFQFFFYILIELSRVSTFCQFLMQREKTFSSVRHLRWNNPRIETSKNFSSYNSVPYMTSRFERKQNRNSDFL